jgi:hypothetical protein
MSSTLYTRLLSFWILFCVACNVAGWVFSLGHCLTHTVYVVLLLMLVILGAASVSKPETSQRGSHWNKLKARFAHPFPLGFLILAGMAVLGGILYAPTNYDGLAYRTPRVLHWLAEHRWHWIHTEFQRLNARGVGFEWVCAPFISVTGTDRFLFLINVFSFLLLPGLTFSVFTRFGMARRLAYYWMWILPTGYCFLLQAGSIGNDLFAAPFVLAAIDFALRARQQNDIFAGWLSILSAALFTSAKANTLPLGAVWLVVIFPCWRLFLSHRVTTILVGMIAILASFVPTAFLNQKYSGDWTGASAEALPIVKANSLVRVAGNAGILAVHCLMPPIFPPAKAWNERIAPRLLSKSLNQQISHNFMISDSLFTVSELEIEESAGLGLGISIFLLAFMTRCRVYPRSALALMHFLAFAAIAIALLAFMRASFVKSTARLLTPYYPLLVMPLLVIFGRERISRSRQWIVGIPVFGMAALLLVLNPARPLWPAKSVINSLKQRLGGRLLERAETVYSVYGDRAHAFDPALRLLPADARVFGIVSFDDPETALWRPFGSRRIVHVCSGDSAQFLRDEDVSYIWVNEEKFTMLFPGTFEAWLDRIRAEQLQTISLQLRAGQGPVAWHLVRLRD